MVLEPLLQAPPILFVVLGVLAVAALPRRPGYALGILSLLPVALVSLTADHGTYVAATAFGVFEVVLFQVDAVSALMGLIFSVIGMAAVLYAYSSGMDRAATAAALAYVAGGIGTVFAGDWLTLVFCWELMAVASTLLVWRHGGDAVRAGFRYAVAHGIGGSLLLFAVMWHYAVTGSLVFTDTGIAAGWPAVLAAIGIGVNVGFVGLHTWLPDTYPRPHVAASVFLCVYTTKAGVYGMYRAFPDGHIWIAYMGGAMAVFGAFYALFQHDMRRLLSYHIQSQVGYMIAGVGVGTALAAAGAFAHVFNHILYKALLFMAVGVLIYRTGEHDLYELGGLWRVMPVTFAAFVIGAVSIAGVPGFNGFVSKGMVLDAAKKEHVTAVYWLLKIGAVGTFLSFIKLGYYAFLRGDAPADVRDAAPGQTISMLGIGGLCVLFGMWWTGLAGLTPFISAHDIHPYSLGHLTDALLLFTVSAVGFAVIRQPLQRVGRLPDVDSGLYPAVFYGTQRTVRIVTGLFRTVDHGAVRGVGTLYWIGTHPEAAVAAVAQRLPDRLFAAHIALDPEQPSRPALRAGIGTGVALLAVVLSLILWTVL